MATPQLRVLLVEDDDCVHEPLAAYLRQCGMSVEVADSLAAASAWLAGLRRADVALIDNLLPQQAGMPPTELGVRLVTDLRGRFPELECILFTGGDVDAGLAALHAGAYRYLTKPLHPEEVALHVRLAAEQAHLRRERNLLSTALAINNELTSHLDTDITLQKIVDAVPRLVGADIATVVLENPETGKFDRFQSTPHRDATVSWRAHLRGRGLTRQIIRTGEPYSVVDVTARNDIDESLRHTGVKSFIGVPIRGEQRHLGVLYAYSLRPFAFPEQAEQVLELLAGQATIALSNARLYERAASERDRAERLASQLLSLHEIAREMQSELSPGRLLDMIAAAAVKLVQADSGCILLLDTERAVLSVRAAWGLGDKVKTGTRVAVGRSIAGRVVQSGAPLIVNDVPNDARFDNPAAEDERFLAIISTPLFVNGECIGTLDVHSKQQAHRFGDEELQILGRMADQASIALGKARYVDEIQTGLRTLRLMYEAGHTIIAAHEQKAVLHHVVRAAVRVLNSWRAKVVLIDAAGARQELAQVGFALDVEQSEPVHSQEVSVQVASTGKPWFGEDVRTTTTPLNPPILVDQVRGAACVPLAIHGHTIGVLWVHFREPHRFTETEREALRLFASQASVALTNARLVADLQQQKEHFLRLFHSAPTGIISVDGEGNISSANDRTGEILNMRAEALHGQPVNIVYHDPAMSRQVGRLLHDAPGGRIANVETHLRDASGLPVPIRLAAAWLYGADGQPNGSVGYFEDLRSLRDTENRLKLLLDASNVVARAERLDSGLHDLARLVVDVLDATFCRILVLDESKQVLVAEAAYIHPAIDGAGWQPHLAERIDSTEWGSRAEFLEASGPVLCRWEEERRRDFLATVSQQLGLQAEIQALLIIPLRTSHNVVGLLGVGTLQPWRTAPFTPEQQELALAIANQTATLIERIWLFERNRTARARLRLFYEASNTLVSGRAPEQVLRHIVQQVRLATEASWVNIILIDETGIARTLITDGAEQTLALPDLIRPTGVSMRVMRTAKPVKIEDAQKQRQEVNPTMLLVGVQAALCMPFAVHGKLIGVLWLHYHEPRYFPDFEVDALQLFVNGAAVAYDVSSHLAQLEALRLAVQGLAQATAVEQVLAEIAQSVCTVLRADSAAIWSFDSVRQHFDVQQSFAAGIAGELWERMRRKEPQRGGATFTVLEAGRLVVNDIEDGTRYPFLGDATRRFLRQAGARCFVGLALTMEQEQLGVLYINYNYAHTLRQEEEEILQTFAHHAALALKKAKLLEQISQVRTVAKGVAEMTVLENLDNTLRLVAEETRNVLHADAVTLFAYDQEQDRFHYPPTFVGVRYKDRAIREAQVLRGSIVEEMLRRDEPYLTEDVANDPLFRDRRFAREEGVASAIATPLHVNRECVGVMFVNYHSRHHFTANELESIRLFASQTAVAIRNAQLFEKLKRRASDFAALYAAGNAITASFELDEILNRIAEQAASVTGYIGERSSIANIVLANGSLLEFCAAYPRASLEQVRRRLGAAIDLRTAAGGRIGLIGRAFVSAQPLLANDVRKHPDYLLAFDDIRAEVVVPVISGDEIFGVINVEHTQLNAFDQGHLQVLQALAAQAAVALQNYRRYETLQRRTQHLQAVYIASKAISTELAVNQTELLTRILREAVERLKPARARSRFGAILLYDAELKEVYIEAIYPPNATINEGRHWGERRRLEGRGGRIGISGRAVLTSRTQRVKDVRLDPDYVDLHSPTLSQLSVPLLEGDAVLGVLSLESDLVDAFDAADEEALQLLAELAVIAIRNSRQYQELKQTKGQVGARTAMAWMGMVSSQWRHAIEGHAVNIRDEVELLRKVAKGGEGAVMVQRRLDKIERLAQLILDKGLTPPLTGQEGVDSQDMDVLVRERLRQLQENDAYKEVTFRFESMCERPVTVRCSPEWLRHVIDLLVDNAVDAMRTVSPRRLSVVTRPVGAQLQVAFTDSGPGIPPDRIPLIGRQPISKSPGEKGLGMGLLMAQMILQTYNGDIVVGPTGPTGTTMFIHLPIEATPA